MFEPKNSIDNLLSNYYYNMYDEGHYMNLLWVTNRLNELKFSLSRYQDWEYARQQYNLTNTTNEKEVEIQIEQLDLHIARHVECIEYVNHKGFSPHIAQFLITSYQKYIKANNIHKSDLIKLRNSIAPLDAWIADKINYLTKQVEEYTTMQKNLELLEQDLKSPEFQATEMFKSWSTD